MPQTDWNRVSAAIKKATNLACSPIAVMLLQDIKQLTQMKSVRQLQATAPCQMAAWARYYGDEGQVGASAQGIKCVWGAACTGLMGSPDRLTEGKLAWRYAKDADAGKRIQESMGVLGVSGKQFDALVMTPLELAPMDPDVIVMYVTPAQALRMVIAYAFLEGDEVKSVLTGQSSLCSAIAYAYEDKRMVIDLPCVGDRTYGMVQEQEMIVAFPASRVDQIMTGIRGSEGFSSHPYKPFLRWPVIFFPDMEPRNTELE